MRTRRGYRTCKFSMNVLGPSPDLRPSMRDIDNDIMRVKKLRIPDTHAFTAEDANAEPQENSNDVGHPADNGHS